MMLPPCTSASTSSPAPDQCSIRSSICSLSLPCPSDTAQLSPANHIPVAAATPTTHASFPGQSGVTHSREMKFAARMIQNTSTPTLPITRTRPVINAECGCSRSSNRSSMRSAAALKRTGGSRTDLDSKNLNPKNSMNTKLNSSIAAFTYPRVKNDANPVKAIKQ